MNEYNKKDDIVYIDDAATLRPVDTIDGQRIAALKGDGLVKSRFDRYSVWQTLWTFRIAAIYCFFTFTASIVDGYEVTMAGSIIANAGFKRQFGALQDNGDYVLNTTWVSAWGAIINVGQIMAMTHVSFVADRFGRRSALQLGWLYVLIALILMTVARSPPVWLVGKLLMGMGVGTSQVASTPYVIEIAPVRCRGALIAIGMIWGSIGGVTCSVMMQVLNQNHPYDWLLPIYIEYGMLGLMAICYLVIPETPWYYGRRNDKTGCFKSMRRLYGSINNYDYEEEWGIILRTIEHEREELAASKSTPWSDCWKGLNGKRMLILVIMCSGQQFGGNALISTYSTYFFEFAGLKDPFTGTMSQTCIGFIAVVVYCLVIDKLGRRWPICLTYTILTAILFIIGGVWYAHTAAAQSVLLALVCIWQPCFTVFASSYPLIASELPSAQLRMKTGVIVWFYQALLGIALWWVFQLINAEFSFAVPPLLTDANVRAAFLFAGLSVPVTIFLWIYLPETKGRAIAEMDELFERQIPAWRWSKFVTAAEQQLQETISAENAKTRGLDNV